MGPGTATNLCTASPNQLGLDKDRGWSVNSTRDFHAMNWYHASVKRVVQGVLHLNAQLCAHMKGSVHRHYNQ